MNLINMINELKEERDRVSEAIKTLECLASHAPKRRGRPPLWMKNTMASSGASPIRRHAKRSVETRRRMSIAQKKRWANA